MAKLSYWELRAKARQAAYDRASNRAIADVSRAYDRMVRQTLDDAERILGNFSKAFGLSRDEAMAMLKQPVPRAVAQSLRARAEALPKGAERDRLLGEASAEAYAARLTRLAALKDSAQLAALETAKVEQRVGQKHMDEMLVDAFHRTMFDVQKYTGLGFGFGGMDTRSIRHILRTNWSGKHFSQRVWHNANVTAQNLSHALIECAMQGKASGATFQALMEASGGSRFAANRLLRTETNYVTGQGELEAFEEAGISRYRYVAVLDGRTSEICQELDGKEFDLKDAEVGVNMHPMHPWCRSGIEPVIDSVARDKQTRWARNPVTGEQMTVPGDMSYKEWMEDVKSRHGVNEVEFKQKAIRNRSADLDQYEKYQRVIGKDDLPDTFEGFQRMKYMEPETYGLVKLDYSRQNHLLHNPDLALPNADTATAADAKFTRYLFNQDSARGWPKGVAFESRLGYNASNWEELRRRILAAAPKYPVVMRGEDEHGISYGQQIILRGQNGKLANVVLGWKSKDCTSWMTTAYIKAVKTNGKNQAI